MHSGFSPHYVQNTSKTCGLVRAWKKRKGPSSSLLSLVLQREEKKEGSNPFPVQRYTSLFLLFLRARLKRLSAKDKSGGETQTGHSCGGSGKCVVGTTINQRRKRELICTPVLFLFQSVDFPDVFPSPPPPLLPLPDASASDGGSGAEATGGTQLPGVMQVRIFFKKAHFKTDYFA